jgi:enamine deaminase RidA (YjgF/YER057c/UK114 family)
LTLKPLPGEGIVEPFQRLAIALEESDTALAKLMIFGSVSAQPAANEALRRIFPRINWPITWVQGASCDKHPIAGIQAFAFSAGKINEITLEGRVVGSVIEEHGARHCLLGGLGPAAPDTSRADQLRQTQENLETALQQAGFSFGDVVRTWYFLEDLLEWYDAFNAARTKSYSRIKFRAGSFPASTAISAQNPAGTALTAGAWAVQPLDASARVTEVPSPLQCPAAAYGSSFSRAVEISSSEGRRLLISGTASIAPGGRTIWRGRLSQQIVRTMEVVESILVSSGYGFSDITRATAYFKNCRGHSAFGEWCAARGLSELPAIASHCGICRADLLFELEADAWKATPVL